MNTYQDLIVWQKARMLAKSVYINTNSFPSDERFGLTSQMRRASVSIASNLAEGYRRNSRGDWRQFVRYSYGSAAELETQCVIAEDIGIISNDVGWQEMKTLLNDVLRLLNRLLQSINN